MIKSSLYLSKIGNFYQSACLETLIKTLFQKWEYLYTQQQRSMKSALFRQAHFNAAHRLYVRDWSDEKNFEVFGKCANPNFHGHNYVIEIKVSGEVDPVTGMVIDLFVLKKMIREHIEDKFDHKNLNVDVDEFKTMMPTVENICYLSWKILREVLEDKYDLVVRLYETPRNYAEYPA